MRARQRRRAQAESLGRASGGLPAALFRGDSIMPFVLVDDLIAHTAGQHMLARVVPMALVPALRTDPTMLWNCRRKT